ncbi:hypothetical protein GJ496_004576 [Pomphorhynchus laevis]|nr:hypothetical protein GJ496_004576 [Pomphorhynchus laevis]
MSRVPQNWMEYNKIIYPPNCKDVVPFVHNMKPYIHSSWKRMYYIARMVRGMQVDEALTQLSYANLSEAEPVKSTILEACEMAVKQHNIEFPSSLWISQSMVTRAMIIKGIRKGFLKPSLIRYRYNHYFVRLEEGKAPEQMYPSRLKNINERISDRITQYRQKRITKL